MDFATNRALPTPVTNKPDIWAHLFALDQWAPFCGADAHALLHSRLAAYDIPTTFARDNSTKDTDEDDEDDVAAHVVTEENNNPSVYVRFKNAADSVALISSIGRDASHISACSFEAILERPSSLADDSPPLVKYVVRVAKNGAFPPNEVLRLRTLIEEVVKEVDMVDWTTQKLEKENALADGPVLDKIVAHCRSKITDTVMGKNRKADAATSGRDAIIRWAGWKADNSITFKPPADSLPNYDISSLVAPIKVLCSPISQETSNYDVCTTILAANSVANCMDSLIDLGIPVKAQRYIARLGRYSTAATSLIRCLRYIKRKHQQDARSLVTLETIQTSDVLFSASQDDEPATFEAYLQQNFSLKTSALQPAKSSRIKEMWASSRQKRTAFLHAELKIAMFYALNPSLFPLNGYIGLSKKCCLLCDFVLKSLRKDGASDPAYAVDVAGPPLLFCVRGCVRGTYGGLTPNWAFPNTDAMRGCPSFILPGAKRELQKRLDAIRIDLSALLKSKVEAMLTHIRDDPDIRRGEESDGDDADERAAANSRRLIAWTARIKQWAEVS